MNVCVIGNSHVAALRDAGPPPGAAPTYFAAPRRSVTSLEPRGGRLVSDDEAVKRSFRMTSGGADVIAPERFDAFAVVGLVGLGRILRECSAHRTVDVASDEGTPLISEACFRDVIRGHVTYGAAHATLTKLRAVTARPVVLMPAPLPTKGVPHRWPELGALWEREPRYVRNAGTVLGEVLEQLPEPVAFQPARTIEDDIFTASEYARDARSLQGKQREDSIHVNAEYGRVAWEAILAALQANAD